MTDQEFDPPRPSGIALLALARDHLLREILPLLPPERRGEARMIGRAIDVAIAESTADDRDDATLVRALADLGFRDLATLAAAIRSGACDDDPALEAWLRDYAAFKLRRISGEPLAGDGGGDG